MRKSLGILFWGAMSLNIAAGEILLPDPTIFYDNGVYYLTGTGRPQRGVSCLQIGESFRLGKNRRRVADVAGKRRQIFLGSTALEKEWPICARLLFKR